MSIIDLNNISNLNSKNMKEIIKIKSVLIKCIEKYNNDLNILNILLDSVIIIPSLYKHDSIHGNIIDTNIFKDEKLKNKINDTLKYIFHECNKIIDKEISNTLKDVTMEIIYNEYDIYNHFYIDSIIYIIEDFIEKIKKRINKKEKLKIECENILIKDNKKNII